VAGAAPPSRLGISVTVGLLFLLGMLANAIKV
jgi:hypothetical protein